MEEIDLCCRMIARGFRVVATSFSEVYQVGGASLNQGNPKKTYHNFRNNLLLLYKNLSPEKRGKILLKRRLMDTLAFGMFVLKLDFRNAWSVIRAHNDFRKMRKLYDEGKHFYVEPEQILSDRLIAVDRYLRRKKK